MHAFAEAHSKQGERFGDTTPRQRLNKVSVFRTPNQAIYGAGGVTGGGAAGAAVLAALTVPAPRSWKEEDPNPWFCCLCLSR